MATRGGMRQSPRSRWRTFSPAWMPRPRTESRGRSRALQALYAWGMRGSAKLDAIAQQVWDDLAVPVDERAFASRLLAVVDADGAEIDDAIGEVTTNWRLE